MKKLRREPLRRLFRIWQKTGIIPFHRYKAAKPKKRDFFTGTFDGIPFLNEDAKRTFVHLLLRPGYMIRDYLMGHNEIYLAPFTALVIFYAFFSLVNSVVNPQFEVKGSTATEQDVLLESKDSTGTFVIDSLDSIAELDDIRRGSHEDAGDEIRSQIADRMGKSLGFIRRIVVLSRLDLHPEEIDSPVKASIASLEGNLRSQGIQEFLGRFILLWFAIWLIARRRMGFGLSASATASAYILCQFSFYRLFTLILTWGKDNTISIILMAIIMVYDFEQLFGISRKKSIRLTIGTGVCMLAIYAVLFLIFGAALTAISLI